MQFGLEGIFCPGDETAPMILGFVPDDLDQIEFGAIGWQVEKLSTVCGHPAIQGFLGDVVVDSGVVDDDEHGFAAVVLLEHPVKEVDDGFALDRLTEQAVMQFLCGVVQRANDGALGVVCRFGAMRLTDRRPGALHGRRGTESGFVKVDHVALPVSGALAEFTKGTLHADEIRFDAFFLRLKRVRLKLKPRALSPLLSVSRQHGRAH